LRASNYKEGWGDLQKNQNFTSFFLVLPIFFLMCVWGLVLVAMQVQCQVVEFGVLPHYFTNIAAPNAAKQRMTKCHPQKSLSNNARFVVRNLPPSSYKNPFFMV